MKRRSMASHAVLQAAPRLLACILDEVASNDDDNQPVAGSDLLPSRELSNAWLGLKYGSGDSLMTPKEMVPLRISLDELARATVVCRSWRPVAQALLFKYAVITVKTTAQAHELGQSTRVLELGRNLELFISKHDAALGVRDALILATRYEQLDYLRLAFTDEAFERHFLPLNLPRLRTLLKIEIFAASQIPLSSLVGLLRLAPNVDRVHLILSNGVIMDRIKPAVLRRLEHLTVEGEGSHWLDDDLLARIFDIETLNQIKTLTCDRPDVLDNDAKVLQAMSGSLRTLNQVEDFVTVWMNRPDLPDEFLKLEALATFTNLTEITSIPPLDQHSLTRLLFNLPPRVELVRTVVWPTLQMLQDLAFFHLPPNALENKSLKRLVLACPASDSGEKNDWGRRLRRVSAELRRHGVRVERVDVKPRDFSVVDVQRQAESGFFSEERFEWLISSGQI